MIECCAYVYEFQVKFNLTGQVLSLESLIETRNKPDTITLPLTLYNGFGFVIESLTNIKTREYVAFIGSSGAGKSQLLEAYKAYLKDTVTEIIEYGTEIAPEESGVAFTHNGTTYYETMGFLTADVNYVIQACRTLKNYPPRRIVIVLQYGARTPEEGLPAALKDIQLSALNGVNPFLIVVTRIPNGANLGNEDFRKFVLKNIAALSLPQSTTAIFVNSLSDGVYGCSFGLDHLHEALRRMDRCRLNVSRTPLQQIYDFLVVNQTTLFITSSVVSSLPGLKYAVPIARASTGSFKAATVVATAATVVATAVTAAGYAAVESSKTKK